MQGCALRKVVRNLAHKNWKTGESNPSTSLHRSRDQRRPVGLRWAVGWQKNRAPRETQGRRVHHHHHHFTTKVAWAAPGGVGFFE